MWLINLTISLFSILKVRALECVSVVIVNVLIKNACQNLKYLT